MVLTADRNTAMREGTVLSVPVAAGATIYAGAIVVANATGFAAPGTTALGLRALGRAESQVDNAAGVDGALDVTVRRGVFHFANSVADPVTQADIGNTCYIEDDQTIAKTTGTNTRSAAGKLIEVDATGVWLEIQ